MPNLNEMWKQIDDVFKVTAICALLTGGSMVIGCFTLWWCTYPYHPEDMIESKTEIEIEMDKNKSGLK